MIVFFFRFFKKIIVYTFFLIFLVFNLIYIFLYALYYILIYWTFVNFFYWSVRVIIQPLWHWIIKACFYSYFFISWFLPLGLKIRCYSFYKKFNKSYCRFKVRLAIGIKLFSFFNSKTFRWVNLIIKGEPFSPCWNLPLWLSFVLYIYIYYILVSCLVFLLIFFMQLYVYIIFIYLFVLICSLFYTIVLKIWRSVRWHLNFIFSKYFAVDLYNTTVGFFIITNNKVIENGYYFDLFDRKIKSSNAKKAQLNLFTALILMLNLNNATFISFLKSKLLSFFGTEADNTKGFGIVPGFLYNRDYSKRLDDCLFYNKIHINLEENLLLHQLVSDFNTKPFSLLLVRLRNLFLKTKDYKNNTLNYKISWSYNQKTKESRRLFDFLHGVSWSHKMEASLIERSFTEENRYSFLEKNGRPIRLFFSFFKSSMISPLNWFGFYINAKNQKTLRNKVENVYFLNKNNALFKKYTFRFDKNNVKSKWTDSKHLNIFQTIAFKWSLLFNVLGHLNYMLFLLFYDICGPLYEKSFLFSLSLYKIRNSLKQDVVMPVKVKWSFWLVYFILFDLWFRVGTLLVFFFFFFKNVVFKGRLFLFIFTSCIECLIYIVQFLKLNNKSIFNLLYTSKYKMFFLFKFEKNSFKEHSIFYKKYGFIGAFFERILFFMFFFFFFFFDVLWIIYLRIKQNKNIEKTLFKVSSFSLSLFIMFVTDILNPLINFYSLMVHIEEEHNKNFKWSLTDKELNRKYWSTHYFTPLEKKLLSLFMWLSLIKKYWWSFHIEGEVGLKRIPFFYKYSKRFFWFNNSLNACRKIKLVALFQKKRLALLYSHFFKKIEPQLNKYFILFYIFLFVFSFFFFFFELFLSFYRKFFVRRENVYYDFLSLKKKFICKDFFKGKSYTSGLLTMHLFLRHFFFFKEKKVSFNKTKVNQEKKCAQKLLRDLYLSSISDYKEIRSDKMNPESLFFEVNPFLKETFNFFLYYTKKIKCTRRNRYYTLKRNSFSLRKYIIFTRYKFLDRIHFIYFLKYFRSILRTNSSLFSKYISNRTLLDIKALFFRSKKHIYSSSAQFNVNSVNKDLLKPWHKNLFYNVRGLSKVSFWNFFKQPSYHNIENWDNNWFFLSKNNFFLKITNRLFLRIFVAMQYEKILYNYGKDFFVERLSIFKKSCTFNNTSLFLNFIFSDEITRDYTINMQNIFFIRITILVLKYFQKLFKNYSLLSRKLFFSFFFYFYIFILNSFSKKRYNLNSFLSFFRAYGLIFLKKKLDYSHESHDLVLSFWLNNNFPYQYPTCCEFIQCIENTSNVVIHLDFPFENEFALIFLRYRKYLENNLSFDLTKFLTVLDLRWRAITKEEFMWGEYVDSKLRKKRAFSYSIGFSGNILQRSLALFKYNLTRFSLFSFNEFDPFFFLEEEEYLNIDLLSFKRKPNLLNSKQGFFLFFFNNLNFYTDLDLLFLTYKWYEFKFNWVYTRFKFKIFLTHDNLIIVFFLFSILCICFCFGLYFIFSVNVIFLFCSFIYSLILFLISCFSNFIIDFFSLGGSITPDTWRENYELLLYKFFLSGNFYDSLVFWKLNDHFIYNISNLALHTEAGFNWLRFRWCISIIITISLSNFFFDFFINFNLFLMFFFELYPFLEESLFDYLLYYTDFLISFWLFETIGVYVLYFFSNYAEYGSDITLLLFLKILGQSFILDFFILFFDKIIEICLFLFNRYLDFSFFYDNFLKGSFFLLYYLLELFFYLNLFQGESFYCFCVYNYFFFVDFLIFSKILTTYIYLSYGFEYIWLTLLYGFICCLDFFWDIIICIFDILRTIETLFLRDFSFQEACLYCIHSIIWAYLNLVYYCLFVPFIYFWFYFLWFFFKIIQLPFIFLKSLLSLLYGFYIILFYLFYGLYFSVKAIWIFFSSMYESFFFSCLGFISMISGYFYYYVYSMAFSASILQIIIWVFTLIKALMAFLMFPFYFLYLFFIHVFLYYFFFPMMFLMNFVMKYFFTAIIFWPEFYLLFSEIILLIYSFFKVYISFFLFIWHGFFGLFTFFFDIITEVFPALKHMLDPLGGPSVFYATLYYYFFIWSAFVWTYSFRLFNDTFRDPPVPEQAWKKYSTVIEHHPVIQRLPLEVYRLLFIEKLASDAIEMPQELRDSLDSWKLVEEAVYFSRIRIQETPLQIQAFHYLLLNKMARNIVSIYYKHRYRFLLKASTWLYPARTFINSIGFLKTSYALWDTYAYFYLTLVTEEDWEYMETAIEIEHSKTKFERLVDFDYFFTRFEYLFSEKHRKQREIWAQEEYQEMVSWFGHGNIDEAPWGFPVLGRWFGRYLKADLQEQYRLVVFRLNYKQGFDPKMTVKEKEAKTRFLHAWFFSKKTHFKKIELPFEKKNSSFLQRHAYFDSGFYYEGSNRIIPDENHFIIDPDDFIIRKYKKVKHIDKIETDFALDPFFFGVRTLDILLYPILSLAVINTGWWYSFNGFSDAIARYTSLLDYADELVSNSLEEFETKLDLRKNKERILFDVATIELYEPSSFFSKYLPRDHEIWSLFLKKNPELSSFIEENPIIFLNKIYDYVKFTSKSDKWVNSLDQSNVLALSSKIDILPRDSLGVEDLFEEFDDEFIIHEMVNRLSVDDPEAAAFWHIMINIYDKAPFIDFFYTTSDEVEDRLPITEAQIFEHWKEPPYLAEFIKLGIDNSLDWRSAVLPKFFNNFAQSSNRFKMDSVSSGAVEQNTNFNWDQSYQDDNESTRQEDEYNEKNQVLVDFFNKQNKEVFNDSDNPFWMRYHTKQNIQLSPFYWFSIYPEFKNFLFSNFIFLDKCNNQVFVLSEDKVLLNLVANHDISDLSKHLLFLSKSVTEIPTNSIPILRQSTFPWNDNLWINIQEVEEGHYYKEGSHTINYWYNYWNSYMKNHPLHEVSSIAEDFDDEVLYGDIVYQAHTSGFFSFFNTTTWQRLFWLYFKVYEDTFFGKLFYQYLRHVIMRRNTVGFETNPFVLQVMDINNGFSGGINPFFVISDVSTLKTEFFNMYTNYTIYSHFNTVLLQRLSLRFFFHPEDFSDSWFKLMLQHNYYIAIDTIKDHVRNASFDYPLMFSDYIYRDRFSIFWLFVSNQITELINIFYLYNVESFKLFWHVLKYLCSFELIDAVYATIVVPLLNISEGTKSLLPLFDSCLDSLHTFFKYVNLNYYFWDRLRGIGLYIFLWPFLEIYKLFLKFIEIGTQNAFIYDLHFLKYFGLTDGWKRTFVRALVTFWPNLLNNFFTFFKNGFDIDTVFLIFKWPALCEEHFIFNVLPVIEQYANEFGYTFGIYYVFCFNNNFSIFSWMYYIECIRFLSLFWETIPFLAPKFWFTWLTFIAAKYSQQEYYILDEYLNNLDRSYTNWFWSNENTDLLVFQGILNILSNDLNLNKFCPDNGFKSYMSKKEIAHMINNNSFLNLEHIKPLFARENYDAPFSFLSHKGFLVFSRKEIDYLSKILSEDKEALNVSVYEAIDFLGHYNLYCNTLQYKDPSILVWLTRNPGNKDLHVLDWFKEPLLSSYTVDFFFFKDIGPDFYLNLKRYESELHLYNMRYFFHRYQNFITYTIKPRSLSDKITSPCSLELYSLYSPMFVHNVSFETYVRRPYPTEVAVVSMDIYGNLIYIYPYYKS